ncbi:MAG: hypothetical protein A3G35_11640 [candidate division NC10 bacterium RIFCSPLOWO2_12_FULL_66_18]|nr:MAG: hypothetical protein A3G35_11640 [candidate division NC10 bacterium RIFCSPLOWO2_12_FULL_66_18]
MKITGVQVRMFSSLIPPERRHRTDLGQAYSPVPAEGHRMFLAALVDWVGRRVLPVSDIKGGEPCVGNGFVGSEERPRSRRWF